MRTNGTAVSFRCHKQTPTTSLTFACFSPKLNIVKEIKSSRN
ncbi:unnamed protein product [Chondrus crispus]|uniref:Uncharacterized protein n=1 Tax=Chondrus crispus TaxID=2769 RepID=R7QB44_CHOCR|nr:unnamed protein product [Chondrus crispus]CDF35737.1 unnamed protein product [Chondrus crispus]|eukprot:XP_005715556.1 unnamed protein product [Chondrus crispus]